MSAKHTPGPWQSKGRYVGNANSPCSIAECLDNCGNWSNDETSIANARLIAAAPEMLSALRKAVVMLAGVCVHSPELSPHETYEAVSAAIAKATGAAQ